MEKKPNITIIVDNPNSWIHPYVKTLARELKKKKFNVRLTSSITSIKKGGIAIFLSCEEIVKDSVLKRSSHNLVVHASRLPKGRGMSPLTWQIEEGKNKIPVTLFEAVAGVDAGEIYTQDHLAFSGHELIEELREGLGQKINSMILDFFDKYPNIKSRRQTGTPTFYRHRGPEDSELDINKSIKEQFNRLRVVDNARYPATFKYRGQRYIVKIYKDN